MQVIEVIPLKKGVPLESLSYYSSDPYAAGSIIDIPVRNKEIKGMVVNSKPVSTAKTALRTATFSLRKLPNQSGQQQLPQTLLKTAKEVARNVPAHLGSILYSMLPPDVRSGARTYPQVPDHLSGDYIPPMVLTATIQDRYIAYRSHIREAFAHRGSVLFVVPTSAAVEQAVQLLSSGIEKRVISFSSTHTKKNLDNSYQKFEDLSHAQLIITTPNFAFLCRHDITTIIIENSGSPHYVSRSRPYLDVREVMRMYAKTIGAEMVLGDNLPRTEDEVMRREEYFSTFEEHPKRLGISSSVVIARHPTENLNFSLLTKELKEHIDLTLNNRGRVFLYASRRGLAPVVLCKDCGHIFRCADSGAPFSLLRSGKGEDEKRWFYCGTSGRRIPAADTCPDCGSWRLMEQGVGIQQVADEIKKEYPKLSSLLLDHTTANTHAKAKKLIDRFYSEKKVILIGSNLALPYLIKPVDCTAVISYEAMRSIPTWRADETIFQTLLTLREITHKDLVVQTRTEPDELLNLASKGLVDQFYDGEIEIRRSLGYPPFSTFVLLTYSGNKTQVQKIESEISIALKEVKPTFYNGPLSSPDKTIRYGLIRIPASKFPSESLIKNLLTLPPYVKVEINPAKIV